MMLAPSMVASPEFDSLTSVDTIEDGDAQIVGYDATGAVVGSIAVWKDSRSRTHITVDYGDGSAQVIVANGELVTFDSTLDPATLAHRNARMIGSLSPDEQASWVMCGAAAGAAVIAWGTGNPVTGAFMTIATYCYCADAADTKYMPEC